MLVAHDFVEFVTSLLSEHAASNKAMTRANALRMG
jgi:hypothetical protein